MATARDIKKYPMATRLSEQDTEYRALLHFMEWIAGERKGRRYEFARMEGENDFWTPCIERIDDLIFEFLGIDPKKLEQERRQMLEDMANASSAKAKVDKMAKPHHLRKRKTGPRGRPKRHGVKTKRKKIDSSKKIR
ncbi:hypothetical protein LCGC14_0317960 [marine sediment metagenome]|uniref:Uncharacterized protein n=1 Tax=marine sediment metagenome TaxID=412755 RepID=A0A0F9U2J3_9ZZZZ